MRGSITALVLLLSVLALEAVRFKGIFPTAPKCIDCNKKNKKGQTDATVLNEFQCEHGKKMHFDCAMKRLNSGNGFTECPKCNEPFTSSRRHCVLCSKAITKNAPDATKMLGEKAGCDHVNLYHKDCLQAVSRDNEAFRCIICSQEIGASRTCAKCFKSITLADPDGSEVGFSCQHAGMFHARCVEDEVKCPACEADFNVEARCVICCQDFTFRQPNSVRSRRYKCGTEHAKTICVTCTKKLKQCPICNQKFRR